ncbi:peptidylprolyl isomerase [Luteimonas sp. BDR2-5]|uniref:FKBP-type peptidyl-prolyl cis-trans isomerase n=1 Tax=Proluteimonas luteida TaxID=2878685 RepID=UPI001E596266|nr:peptidylprolyl isomerase [Luteimonas sp. BDR2-5]MCD9028227.1 peptidylprolyl isomerase [Luteimonas sp. BDR2-5]
MEIAHRRVATVHFTLSDDSGQRITTTHGHDPLVYMHGTGTIIQGLEQALEGRQAGDRFSVDIPPERGFGPRHDGLVQRLPRSTFTGRGIPAVGEKLRAQTEKGPLDVVVTAIDADSITVDGNNPLAGRPLHAEVEVVAVRVATPQEIQFGL